jgi:hypothetical protein
MLSYSNHPTFTFTPTTGEAYAKAYIHPLAPGLILPLAGSGIPIDLLLRISVQSLGPLNDATMLGGSSGSGSRGFFELLRVLRRLQLAGAVAIAATTTGGEIPITTRSVLAILSDLGAEVIMPAADVASGATQEAIALTGGETRPVMVVHAGHKAPPDA